MLASKTKSADAAIETKPKSQKPAPEPAENQSFRLFTNTPGGMPANAGGSQRFGLIVDDELPLRAGQIHRADFMAGISSDIEITANELLSPAGQTAQDCPYLNHWLRFYQQRTAAH